MHQSISTSKKKMKVNTISITRGEVGSGAVVICREHETAPIKLPCGESTLVAFCSGSDQTTFRQLPFFTFAYMYYLIHLNLNLA